MKKGPVIVTGGTWGAGRAIAARLALDGYQVLACGNENKEIGSIAEKGIDKTRKEFQALGVDVELMDVDVTSAAMVNEMVRLVAERHGGIFGLVNNAAIHPVGNILETPREVWDRVVGVNLTGIFLTCSAVLPYMIQAKRGAIVNIGSGAQWGKPGMAAYSASKGGLVSLSMALAYDHLADHVRVNVVTPGGMPGTGMTAYLEDIPQYSDLKQVLARSTAAGRGVSGADIAGAVSYLLSPDAEIISGTILDVGCFSHQGGNPLR